MSLPNAYSHWSRACPIASAFYELAPKADRERYYSLLKTGSGHALIQQLGNYAAQNAGKPSAEFWDGFSKTAHSEDAEALEQLTRTLKERILKAVETGYLKACGFAVPRKPSDVPIEVPTDLWSGRVKWEDNSIYGHGMRMEAVRVFPFRWLEPEEGKRPGRPSRVDEIRQCYEELKANGKIDFSRPNKAIAQQVRAHILAKPGNEDEAGLGELAIQRAIRDDINAEKQRMSKI